MKRILLIFTLVFFVACAQNQVDDSVIDDTPITVNPMVNFKSFILELPEAEQSCFYENFSNEKSAIDFYSETSFPNPEISDCLSQNSNFRIIQGILINSNINLSQEELLCIKSNNKNEKFDYLRESFGTPVFTYSLGTLFCLNETSRNIYDSSKNGNLFEGIIDNKPLASILPKNINALECFATTSGDEDNSFESTKEALGFIYSSGGLFPIQIFSDISNLADCIEIPKELVEIGLNESSAECLSFKLGDIFSDPLNPSLTDLPNIIVELESCYIDAEALLRYFEFDLPESDITMEEQNIPEEALADERFICFSQELDINDVLEFLYTRKLTSKALSSAENCGISKEEIESIDLSELLENN
tara:strand:- start:48738 stop:49820 length:1083 start_codon:yes stop_codon:yes gene_type:complete